MGCRVSKLRKSARGQECLVRIPNHCNFNPETVVLAHIGGAGMGIKSHNLHGAFCCSNCHDILDGRVNTNYTRNELKLMHWEGVKRTQEYWLKNGFIKA